MKLLTILLLCIGTTAAGQMKPNPKLEDEKLRETILREYLLLYHTETKNQIAQVHLLPMPYFVGDTFTTKDTLTILNHFKPGSDTIMLHLDEGSYVPPGFQVKIVSEGPVMYYLECINNSTSETRKGFIHITELRDYFLPENIGEQAMLYDNLKNRHKLLAEYITKKYDISEPDLNAIVDGAKFRLRHPNR